MLISDWQISFLFFSVLVCTYSISCVFCIICCVHMYYILSCRTLLCHLYPRKGLFTPTFRIVVIDGNKQSVVNDFNQEQFLVGSCEGKSYLCCAVFQTADQVHCTVLQTTCIRFMAFCYGNNTHQVHCIVIET